MIKLKNGKLIFSSNIGEALFLSIYSFFAFSKWSLFIGTNIIRLSVNIYEILLIPILLFYRRQISDFIFRKKKRNKNLFVVIFILGVLFALIGCVSHVSYIIAHLTAYRIVFYFIAIMYFFSNVEVFDISKLELVSFFSILGEFTYIITVGKNENQVLMNSVAICLMIIIPIIYKRTGLAIFLTVFGLFAAYRSTYRITIVLTIVSAFFALLVSFLGRKKYKSLLISCVFGGLFFLFLRYYDKILSFFLSLFNLNNWSTERITSRISFLINGSLSGSNDLGRINSLMKISEYLRDGIFPQGVFRGAIGQTGRYTDIPILFLIDAFGSILAIVLIIIFLFFSVKLIINVFKKGNELVAVLVSMIPNFIILFLINGTFLYWHYVVIFSAIVFGLAINNKINRIQITNNFWLI
jgi:hypothetical protein